MNEAQKKIRNNLLARIHIAKDFLYGNDDVLYREVLSNMFGKGSSADLTLKQMRELIEYFEMRGWNPKKKKKKYACTDKQWRYIMRLKKEMKWTAETLNEYVKKVTTKSKAEELEVWEAKDLITGMLKIKDYSPKKFFRVVK